MTQLKLLETYPYTSADSTSWKLSAAMGSIYTPYGLIYVSERGVNDKRYFLNQSNDAQKNLVKYIESCGFTLEEAVKFDYVRYVINIKYLMNWAENYQYRGGAKRRKLFG